MRKIILTIALAFAAAVAFGQDLSISAGYVRATHIYDNNTSKLPFNGFYAGLGAEWKLDQNFGFATGLYYEFDATSSTISAWGASAGATTTEHYIDIPLHFAAGFEVAQGVRLFLEIGPALSVGLASTTTGNINILGIKIKDASNNYDGGTYGRFDLGIGGIGGIQVGAIKVFGGYNYGLIDRNSSQNTVLNRSQVVAGIAYCL